ncbi:hypothetical protein D3C76_1303050 [compost metagenome]
MLAQCVSALSSGFLIVVGWLCVTINATRNILKLNGALSNRWPGSDLVCDQLLNAGQLTQLREDVRAIFSGTKNMNIGARVKGGAHIQAVAA